MFVTIEGIDGAGKSTLIEHLVPHFDLITREPGGCPLAEAIRSQLLEPDLPINHEAETLLFLAARAQHVAEVIQPALQQNKRVLCDRFVDSTIAYQGYGREQEIEKLCHLACPLEPDLTLLLDLDPKIALSRLKSHDRLEKTGLDFYTRVRDGYLSLAKKHPRIHILDATLHPGQISALALALVATLFETH